MSNLHMIPNSDDRSSVTKPCISGERTRVQISPELPSELVEIIAENLHGDRRTLSSLSTVSKGWTYTSQRHLFSSLHLRVNGEDCAEKLLLFASHFGMGDLVRNFTIEWSPKSTSPVIVDISLLLAGLRRLPQLRTLTLCFLILSYDAEPSQFPVAAPNPPLPIENLILVAVLGKSPIFYNFLTFFQVTHELRLLDSSAMDDIRVPGSQHRAEPDLATQFATLPNCLAQINSLEVISRGIEADRDGVFQLYQFLMSVPWDRLRYLGCGGMFFEDYEYSKTFVDFLQDRGRTLESIQLEIPVSPFLDERMNLATFCSSLTHIRFTIPFPFETLDPDTATWIPQPTGFPYSGTGILAGMTTLLSTAPPSLRRVTINLLGPSHRNAQIMYVDQGTMGNLASVDDALGRLGALECVHFQEVEDALIYPTKPFPRIDRPMGMRTSSQELLRASLPRCHSQGVLVFG